MLEENSGSVNVKVIPDINQDLLQPQVDSASNEDALETTTLYSNIDNNHINHISSGQKPADRTFWLLAIEKLAENFLSVKVWTIFVFMYVSAYLCFTGHMSGTDFATSNGSIISVVYALRESFKTIKIRQAKNIEEIRKMKV
jgi:hypothetical protein